MGRYKELRHDVDSLANRTRDIENNVGQTLVKLDTVIANQGKSDEAYLRADRRELEKTNAQDKHMVEFTNAMQEVKSTLDAVVTSQNDLTKAQEVTDGKVADVEKKQNKLLTVIGTVVFIIGLVWSVATWSLSYMDKQDKFKEAQAAKIATLEGYEYKRYLKFELKEDEERERRIQNGRIADGSL